MKSTRLQFVLGFLILCVLSMTKAIAGQELGRFSVVGEANKTGIFELSEGMTIKQAAILFEGVTQKASLSRIVILTEREPEYRLIWKEFLEVRKLTCQLLPMTSY